MRGQWSETVDAALCNTESGKIFSQPIQQKALSNLTRVGDLLSFDQVYLRPKRGISLTSASSKKTPKSTHHCSVKIGIILIGCLINQIEIACYQPWSIAQAMDVPKLLQEHHFLFIFLWPITPVNHQFRPSCSEKKTEIKYLSTREAIA